MTPEQFIDNFGVIAEAPGGVAKLKELVLSLAVLGKLGTQDENDEPASESLRSISDRKESKAKKGKGAAAPTSPDATRSDWAPATLADVTEDIQIGPFGSQLHKRDYVEGGAPLVNPQNIKLDGIVPTLDKTVTVDTLDRLAKYVLREGDVVMGRRGEMGKCAPITGSEDGWLCGTGSLFLRPPPELNTDFLVSFLRSPMIRGRLAGGAVGATMKNLSHKAVASIPIALPPLAEQKRIVAKVDQLMTLLDDLEQRQEKKQAIAIHVSTASLDSLVDAEDRDQLAQAWRRVSENFGAVAGADQSAVSRMTNAIRSLAVFGRLTSRDQGETAEAVLATARAEHHAAVEEKSTKKTPKHSLPRRQLPPGWKWTVLADLLVFGPRNGFSPKPVNYETPILSLTLSATTSGEFDDSATKFVDIEVEPDSHLWLRPGDILVQRGNTLEYVGVPALFSGAPSRFIYPDLMMKIRVSEALDPEFVHLAMSEDSARNFLRSRASGTSGSMPKINQGALLTLPIPVPPLGEQRRIVARVRHLMAALRALDTRSSALRAAATRLANATTAVA